MYTYVKNSFVVLSLIMITASFSVKAMKVEEMDVDGRQHSHRPTSYVDLLVMEMEAKKALAKVEECYRKKTSDECDYKFHNEHIASTENPKRICKTHNAIEFDKRKDALQIIQETLQPLRKEKQEEEKLRNLEISIKEETLKILQENLKSSSAKEKQKETLRKLDIQIKEEQLKALQLSILKDQDEQILQKLKIQINEEKLKILQQGLSSPSLKEKEETKTRKSRSKKPEADVKVSNEKK